MSMFTVTSALWKKIAVAAFQMATIVFFIIEILSSKDDPDTLIPAAIALILFTTVSTIAFLPVLCKNALVSENTLRIFTGYSTPKSYDLSHYTNLTVSYSIGRGGKYYRLMQDGKTIWTWSKDDVNSERFIEWLKMHYIHVG